MRIVQAAVVIPVKAFHAAKLRLAPAVNPADRARIAAEDAAAEASRTAERLRWEEREKVTIGAPLREEDLIDLTKAELIDLASTAEVPGRSHMSKSELVSALSSQTTVKP